MIQKVHYTIEIWKEKWSKYFATKVLQIDLYLPRQNPNYDWLRRRDSKTL